MRALNLSELANHRAHDYDTVHATAPRCSFIKSWGAYPSVARAEAGRQVRTPSEACVFEVDYCIRSPIKRDQYHDQWRIRFDFSSRQHPFAEPTIVVLSEVRPWIPHVVPRTGVFCLGSLWAPQRYAAHALLDVAKMLNFDENIDILTRMSAHWNPESIPWWKIRHNARAISPLRYPEVVTPAMTPASLDDLFGGIR